MGYIVSFSLVCGVVYLISSHLLTEAVAGVFFMNGRFVILEMSMQYLLTPETYVLLTLCRRVIVVTMFIKLFVRDPLYTTSNKETFI